MASLKEVKSRIVSVTSTQQITKAMKMVAAAKLRKAQDNIIQMRPYAQKLTEILQNVSSGSDGDVQNFYAQNREVENVLLVVVTSDKGLCGPFNSSVFKATEQLIKSKYQAVRDAGNLSVMPIGKRSLDYFKKRNFQVVDDYGMMFSSLSFDKVKVAAEFAMDGFADKKYDRVDIVYNEFKNVATQI